MVTRLMLSAPLRLILRLYDHLRIRGRIQIVTVRGSSPPSPVALIFDRLHPHFSRQTRPRLRLSDRTKRRRQRIWAGGEKGIHCTPIAEPDSWALIARASAGRAVSGMRASTLLPNPRQPGRFITPARDHSRREFTLCSSTTAFQTDGLVTENSHRPPWVGR